MNSKLIAIAALAVASTQAHAAIFGSAEAQSQAYAGSNSDSDLKTLFAAPGTLNTGVSVSGESELGENSAGAFISASFTSAASGTFAFGGESFGSDAGYTNSLTYVFTAGARETLNVAITDSYPYSNSLTLIGSDGTNIYWYLGTTYFGSSFPFSSALANGTQYTLRITGQGFSDDAGPVNGVWSITSSIPEPATWALLIAGFGLVGAAARRRRPRTTLA